MKTASFNEGLVIALISSLIGTVIYYLLSAFVADSYIFRLLISVGSFAYVLYLLSRSQTPIGRVSAMGVWALISVAMWLYWPPAAVFILVHISIIWIIRSLYFYTSLISAMADLGLNLLSIAAAYWAAMQTGSLFLSIWCFFLTQALFVAIPKNLFATNKHKPVCADHFRQSHRAAQAAIAKLSIRS